MPMILALYKKPQPDSPDYLFVIAQVLPPDWEFNEFKNWMLRRYKPDDRDLIKVIPGASLASFPDLLEDLHVKA